MLLLDELAKPNYNNDRRKVRSKEGAMLTEYFEDIAAGDKSEISPGTTAVYFSMSGIDGPFPAQIDVKLGYMHFEALFCTRGKICIEKKDGEVISVEGGEILLLSDISDVNGGYVERPSEGMLVSVDATGAMESLKSFCGILGREMLDTRQVKSVMDAKGGCVSLGGGAWSRSVFDHLEYLPREEHGRYCVLKSLELLYLFCTKERPYTATAADMNHTLVRTLSMAGRYLEEHMDEHITIDELGRMFYISSTSLKAGFRRMYGRPVHAWLREKRMQKAAGLLRSSDLNILEIAQMVGYGSASQFGTAFRKHYGTTPGQYRKMSETEKF